MNEYSEVCYKLNNELFKGAPHRKMQSHVNRKYLELSYLIATANDLLHMIDLIKEGREHNITTDELLGDIQLRLRDVWAALSASKVGCLAFQKLDLDTIANAKDSLEIIESAAIIRRKQ